MSTARAATAKAWQVLGGIIIAAALIGWAVSGEGPRYALDRFDGSYAPGATANALERVETILERQWSPGIAIGCGLLCIIIGQLTALSGSGKY